MLPKKEKLEKGLYTKVRKGQLCNGDMKELEYKEVVVGILWYKESLNQIVCIHDRRGRKG